jgi:uncharacterized protein
MSQQQMMQMVMEETAHLPSPKLGLSITVLTENERNEVLGFLSERPSHTVIMVGLIRDNGFSADLNRGIFYGCRNSEGRLEGVALIGHATLLETRTRRALKEFASIAQLHRRLHMFMAEQEKVNTFWSYYSEDGQPIRVVCRELLFELSTPVETQMEVEGLRLATTGDLDLIAPVHAAMAEAESGINPLESDREGFLLRCTRRIDQGRVWVVVRDGELLFKTDVQAESPELIYLEGVYVSPEMRGTGFGRRCFNSLCGNLLKRVNSLNVLVNEENEQSQVFFRMCGFRQVSNYLTIFLSKA